MNDTPATLGLPPEAIFDALPIGVAVLDSAQRIVCTNPVWCAALEISAAAVQPGTPFAESMRPAAYRGLFGPGDPDEHIATLLGSEASRAGRLRRLTLNERSFDLLSAPLPDGGRILCAMETTTLIAARSDAEAALARLTAALTSWRGGVGVFRPDATLQFSNPRLAELLGLSPERIQPGMSFSAFLDLLAASDDFGGLDGETFITAQRALDRSHATTARRRRSDGRVIWYGNDPMPDGGFTFTLADVTPMATAEDEAQRRARWSNAILDAIPHGVCVYGPDQRVSYFNHTSERLMAGAPIEFGQHMSDVIRRRAEAGEYGPGRPDHVYAEQTAFDLTRPQRRLRRRPNGTMIDVRTAPLPDGGHISVVTDITPLTEAEEELSRRAAEMAVMLASIRHGILLWGPDKRLIASNAMAAELLHHPPGMLAPGRAQDELLDSMIKRGEVGDTDEARAVVEALRERDRSVPYLRNVVNRAGQVLEVRSDPTPGGGWVSTFTDVTEARQAEEELRRAKEAAETANQAKSRFLATMSHELRTPLNAVIGFSDALLREADNPSPARVAEFARQVNDSGRHLLGLINIILDVARIESGRFDLASDRVDVGRLVRGAVRQADAAAQAAEITLVAELREDLPAIAADERRLAQVLRHLLSNAVKFTEIGGTVTIGAELETDGGLLIYVRDTGIGIPKEELERVFEPFTQLESTLVRRFQGAGLGLYVSRALVAGHGGSLVLKDRAGGGTSAEVRLPGSSILLDREASEGAS